MPTDSVYPAPTTFFFYDKEYFYKNINWSIKFNPNYFNKNSIQLQM